MFLLLLFLPYLPLSHPLNAEVDSRHSHDAVEASTFLLVLLAPVDTGEAILFLALHVRVVHHLHAAYAQFLLAPILVAAIVLVVVDRVVVAVVVGVEVLVRERILHYGDHLHPAPSVFIINIGWPLFIAVTHVTLC